MIYHLSNNQRKELLIRSTPIEVFVPTPETVPDDCLAWARGVFGDDGQYISSVDRFDAMVTRGSGGGLDAFIGSIVHDQKASLFCWCVDVVSVCFDPPAKPRRNRKRMQWPGFVLLDDGTRVPEV